MLSFSSMNNEILNLSKELDTINQYFNKNSINEKF